jgi:cobalamin-dependent methionine synthase I
LTDHLTNSSRRAKYTSPDIQNEIINIIGNQIRTSIVESCNNSKFFTLIADETTDTYTREQVSVCLRYLERDPISNKISIKEDFLDFMMATSTTGEHLAELLIETLNNAGINTMNMRAQGYDGAANMSGKYNGVQARILQIVPGAMYVHCKSHCLNLAIVHSCKDTSVRNVMSTVQEVAFSFDYSSKKLQAFYQELDSDATTKENMDKRTKLRTLC